MPSKTPAQAKLMAAAAHTKGGYGGVPQDVGKKFNAADKLKRPNQYSKKSMNPGKGVHWV